MKNGKTEIKNYRKTEIERKNRETERLDSIAHFKVTAIVQVAIETNDKGKDGSACKPALTQDTEYMVEKTYNIAPYLGAFGAY